MTDLQAKYQKLATEYAKLRAQIPVLKKAVLEEQSKEETMRESMKGKDQSLRKFEQEIESLTFRNQQMSARVEVLQRELDETIPKGGKKQKKHAASNQDISHSNDSVIGEELQKKIEENIRLHNQVHEAEKVHGETVMQLQDKLTALESEASRHQQILDSTVASSTAQINKLQEERAVLEVKLQTHEVGSKENRDKVESLEERLKTVSNDLGDQLAEATDILATKLPFNDTKMSELNALNIPTHDRGHQLQTKELIGQAVGQIKELVQALSNYYTYTEQRTKVYPTDMDQEPLSDVNKKLCQYLHENATYLRPVEQSFRSFHESLKEEALTTLETAVGLQDFSSKFKRFAIYANTILPYQLLSLEEECSVSSCPATLVSKNMEVHHSLQKLSSSLSQLDTYVTILAAQSSTPCCHPNSSHPKLIQLLSKAVYDFHETIKEFSRNFNAKVSLEHQLPTANQKLKVTDECIVSALVSLVTCSSKISAFCSGNVEFFCLPVGFRTRGASVKCSAARSHPVTHEFHQRAADYISLVNKGCPESVPHKTAIQNRRTLYSSTESRDSLAQQVVTLHEKVAKLEQDKEHWMLETQLLQMKYEKEAQKVSSLEKLNKMLETKMSGSIEDNLSGSEGVVNGQPGSVITAPSTTTTTTAPGGPVPNTVIQNSMLGQLSMLPSSGQIESDPREQLIKQHYTKRIAELSSKLQQADSRALHFHAECRALHKRLTLSQREQQSLQSDVDTANLTLTQLKDELQTTTKSYEGQLSMMSEHLAGMNEKLTVQKDEIDVLKYQLNNSKGGKKGKK